MTLTSNFGDNTTQSSCTLDESSNWNTLYCSHLWANSNLRQAIINAPCKDNKTGKYCYTCRGKIRSYGITPPENSFLPNNYSTPKLEAPPSRSEIQRNNIYRSYIDDSNNLDNCSNIKASVNDISINNDDFIQHIPTISRQIDTSFRHKYISTQHDIRTINANQRRLRKSLKGIGCVVNWSLNGSPKKRRTQIQACSISVMIIAIVIISLVLVNFTTLNFTQVKNDTSTISVPRDNIEINENDNSSAVVNFYTDLFVPRDTEENEEVYTTEASLLSTTKNSSIISNIILKIQKNIKTYPKDVQKIKERSSQKEILKRNISNSFCSCQTNEVCMLDEISGKSICKLAIDMDDPTGCGGLCAMETEACQLVDKSRGVRVCRLLTQVSCSSQDWRCRNGFCVPSEARCDGSIQCYDRSDEMHCECDLTKQFRCGHSISCFPKKKICDGFIDCWDGYDELNCTMECPEDQFTCTDGQCILSSRFCDGLADCADESDEPQGCDISCRTHEMQCKNRRCVPLGAKCDGRDDCGDDSDETNCS
ncbi:uncharacterized protein LOC124534401 [Vanessa cardui]|uniref:uncharacterized protein LOC124534401 n=1 Tax=Vanessa cardui TaxID=171605 RepID=UPI001F141300|nr:uncharacterized protein LOC124534401 [Vanessa cardui]XP_046966230.1 uncharacterized protein LOC124534401 [Vanessa cardui]XP_046966238.1 uncharacterized protein LOC124534401 [Vanessa cardui]